MLFLLVYLILRSIISFIENSIFIALYGRIIFSVFKPLLTPGYIQFILLNSNVSPIEFFSRYWTGTRSSKGIQYKVAFIWRCEDQLGYKFFRLLGWVWELFWEFLRFQLLFSGFFSAFGLILGAVLKVLWITAPQGPAYYAINLWLLYIMII